MSRPRHSLRVALTVMALPFLGNWANHQHPERKSCVGGWRRAVRKFKDFRPPHIRL